MREIELTRGKVSLIDDADYESVAVFSWYARLEGTVWYAIRKAGNGSLRDIRMHRLLLGAPDGMQVDHLNGNGLDNRRENLRLCTNRENQQNRAKQSKPSSSRFKGVSYHGRGKWQAHIRANGVFRYLGLFASEDDAALAYNVAAKEHFGDFARLNTVGVGRKLA